MPKYTHFLSIDVGNGQQVAVVASAQYIDGMWGHLRSCVSTSHRSDFNTINGMARLAQWKLWNRGKGLWVSLASTV
eukprot:3816992-Amphidinium_carterae.2